MKKIIILSCLISSICIQSIAQVFNDYYTPATIKNYIPPSPNAAGLGKYAEIPVSYSTGVPQISIPFYTIETGNLSLPISLSYHSSGVKVEEEASWVGLGWSLNAGGVITRVVKGIPDDQYKVYGSNYSYQTGFGGDGYFNSAGYFYSSSKIEQYYFGTYNSYNGLTTEIALGQIDGDPDIFYFNFGKYTGSFVFDENRIPRLTSGSALKITFEQRDTNGNLSNTGLISSFTIIAEDGTKFYFQDAESSTVFAGQLVGDDSYQSSPPNPYYFNMSSFFPEEWLTYNSSWYLSRIEASNGPQQITFSYDSVVSFNLSNTSQKSFYGQNHGGSGTYQFINHWSNSLTGIHQKKLKRIDWDNGHITFDANYARIDTKRSMEYSVPSPSTSLSAALTDIKILNLNNDTLKKFKLFYSNFISDGVLGVGVGEQYGYYRLRLDSIREASLSASLPPYQFIYDNSSTLPHRYSYQLDLWGFYNGNGATSSLIPTIYVYPDCNVSTSVYHSIYSVFQRNNGETEYSIAGTNRNANLSYAKAGILNRINYPLGGHETFSYELNAFKADVNTIQGCGLRISEIKRYASETDPNPEIRDFSYNNTDGTTSGIVLNIPKFAYYGYVNLSCIGSHTPEELRLIQAVRFSTPQVGLGAEQSSCVNYKRVTFQNPGNGKTVNEYMFPVSFGTETLIMAGDTIYKRTKGWLSDFPFAPDPNYDFMNGKLKSETIYNNTCKIKEIRYIYDVKSYGKIKAYSSKTMRTESSCIYSSPPVFIVPSGAKYYFLYAWSVLSQKIEVEYRGSTDSIKVVTDYHYDEQNYKQLTSIITNSSIPNENIEVKYKYAQNLIGSIYPVMTTRNMVSLPIEQTKYKNNKVIASQLTLYALKNNYYVPDKIYSIETASPLTTFSSYNGNTMDSHYSSTPEIEYPSYDIYSNPLAVLSKDKPPTCYIWGYHNLYPVAKIEGKVYSEISTSVVSNIDNHSFTYSATYPLTQNEVSYLKGQLAGLMSDPKAMVTFYTYAPLIGLTSQTDPKGITTYYNYDSFLRLDQVLDDKANILKDYKYHLTNQPSPITVYYNDVKSQVFYKQNCIAGFSPNPYTYTVAANTYSSEVSKNDANNRALNDISSNGQNAANLYGTCYNNCSITMATGYYNLTNSIVSNGSSVSFYMVFYSGTNINAATLYKVATISGGCKPSVDRTVNFTSGSNSGYILIKQNGDIYLFNVPSINAYTTINIPTITFNL